jgi:hypothetical protein
MTLYHHTSATNRASISRLGLLRSKAWSAETNILGGVFLTTQQVTVSRCCDTWEVNADGLTLEKDTTTDPFDGDTWFVAWYEDVAVTSLLLIRQGEIAV